jgi:hypothetical protein
MKAPQTTKSEQTLEHEKKSNLAAETCDIQYGKLPLIALSCFVYPSKVSFLLGLACYYA